MVAKEGKSAHLKLPLESVPINFQNNSVSYFDINGKCQVSAR